MKVVLTNLTKKLFVCFLAVIIAVPLISVPTTAYGATFSDIHDHWAESYINKAVSAGVVKGYPDGTFCPDKSVTRAEFTSMVNKALGNTGSTSVSFSDVPYNEWYYNDIAKGISATFVGGYDDNTFRPNNAVTREEAAAMISRFVPTYGTTGSVSSFKDKSSISSWATDAVSKIYGKGYMGAYDDGKYHPQDSLTRAMTAKIICSILDKESIVSSSTTVKSKGTTLSNHIYSNNVTMHSDLGDGEAELSNCVVLGTLYVYGGGEDTITVSNSRVANAYVEKSSSPVRVLAKGQTTINKTTTGNEAILETSGLSGGLSGTGFNDVDIKASADTTLRGSFVKVNVTGSSADVDVESGSITTFNVSSSGRSSDINVNSKASIGTANVNAAAAFNGSGSINTMNVNSSGVTYETKPKYLKMGSGVSSAILSDSDSDYDIAVSPKNKATNVSVDTKITLTFDTAVTKSNGTSIKNSDIDDMVYIRKNSSSGSTVSFSGSISSSKKVITLTPDSDLNDDTKYYVVISKNEFYDTKDKGNVAQTTYFTTGDDSDGTVRFYPKSNETGISRTIDPTITFSEAVETYDGKSISNSYLDCIIFKEGSSSGRNVSFDATINSSKKVITIDPDSTLKEGQKYYLEIPTRKFRTQSGDTNIGSYSVTWTTSSGSAPTTSFTPSNGSTNIALSSNVTVNFSSSVYNTSGSGPDTTYIANYITLTDITNNSSVNYSVQSFSNNSSGAVMVLNPTWDFIAGHRYTVTVPASRFRNSVGTYASSNSSTFTAAGSIDTSSIDTALVAAATAKSGVKTSTNGTDIFAGVSWVTSAQMSALDSAISTANTAKFTVTSKEQADTAANTLTSAINTFNSSKKEGSKIRVDISALTYAIQDARAATTGISPSSDGFDIEPSKKWATQADINTLNSAISTAEAATNTIDTASQVVANTTTLNDAVVTFKSKVSAGKMANKSELSSAISSAKSKLSGVRIQTSASEVPVGSTWVTVEEYTAFSSAITAAIDIFNKPNALQTEVDGAVSTLTSATSSFNPQPGLKQ